MAAVGPRGSGGAVFVKRVERAGMQAGWPYRWVEVSADIALSVG